MRFDTSAPRPGFKALERSRFEYQELLIHFHPPETGDQPGQGDIMKLLRKSFIALSLAVLASGAMAQAKYVLKAGHGGQVETASHKALVRFGETLAASTNGQVKVEVYPDRQLGEEREMVEGLQLGSVDVAFVSNLSSFVPQVSVMDIPFLFSNAEHAYRVLDGKVGQDLMRAMDAKGIVGLAFWEGGWRHLTTKKPVEAPKDLAGMKVRTMQNPVHIEAFKRLGAAPIPMAWGEVFTSLGQGVIDGQENPITIIYTNSLWEVQKHVTLTGHLYGIHYLMMSKPTWNKLPADIQAKVREAAKDATAFQREQSARLEAEQIEKLRKQGMIVSKVDTEPFRTATAEVANALKTVDQKMLAEIRAQAN
jgi:tripartite ATP-independent transporter DctP family solute receptor